VKNGHSEKQKEEWIVMNEKGKTKQQLGNEEKKAEQKTEGEKRNAQRLKEAHEVTITIITDEKNLPKGKNIH
jgi:hypothetical protein